MPRVASDKRATPEIKPDFFIVGAPRCGTTAMSNYLAKHPDIFMARKEMHFFGSDLRFAGHFYRRDEREYLEEFANWNGQRRIGEASVWYLFSTRAAEEIKAFNPEARIIVLLREPVEMIYSLFNQFRYDGNEPLATIQEALDAEPDRRMGNGNGWQTYFAAGLIYRNVAAYTEQLQRYFEVFGRERVLVLLHEDLAANPEAVYRRTLEFLNVDSSYKLNDYPRDNAGKVAKNRVLSAALNNPAMRSALLAVKPLMPQVVFKSLHHIEWALHNRNISSTKPAPLDGELESELRLEFAPKIKQLSNLIGRDLSHWTNKGPVHQSSPSQIRTA